jgi:hypothetical protein
MPAHRPSRESSLAAERAARCVDMLLMWFPWMFDIKVKGARYQYHANAGNLLLLHDYTKTFEQERKQIFSRLKTDLFYEKIPGG